MTRTQWRRYQRSKKGVDVSLEDKTIDPNDGQRMVEPGRRLGKERLSHPLVEEDPNEDDELGSKFMDSEPDFDVICNIVSILPTEYDMVSEVDDSEEEFYPKDIEEYKPMCYFVTNDGSECNRKAVFEQPDDSMKNHLKPLFIKAKVDEIGVNKVLVENCVVVNLMPQSLLIRIGKTDKYLKPHNVILSNYEGWSFPWCSPSKFNGWDCSHANFVRGGPIKS